ncbi:MAG: LacI family DNA-binding transcriptional regulator [Actinomycetota bacterium]
MKPRVRPTLADVAAAAGVSLKTASRALNAEYGVAATTAHRVREAARELGFRPNHLARSLASRQTSAAVGLVIPSVSDPFIAAVVGAVERGLEPRGLQLISTSHGDDPAHQLTLVQTLVDRRVDALVVISAPGDVSYLQSEIDHGLVVVAVDRPLQGVSVDTITADNHLGAMLAVERLLRTGHRRIAAVGTDGRLWTVMERYRGYAAALQAAQIAVDPALVAMDCHDADAAMEAIDVMLALPQPPTALFAAQHRAGRAGIRSMLAAGLVLDLTVFDEVADPDLLVIAPTVVVESDPVRLGSGAAAMALERLDGLRGAARSVVLTPTLQHPRAPSVMGAGAPS